MLWEFAHTKFHVNKQKTQTPQDRLDPSYGDNGDGIARCHTGDHDSQYDRLHGFVDYHDGALCERIESPDESMLN